MTEDRRAVYLTPTGDIEVRNESCPDVGPNEILVDVAASLISPGTELHHISVRVDGDGDFTEPRPMGYQNAGEVVEVGENVDRFARGDTVACMGTGYALHSDVALVPQNLCVELPKNVGEEAGAFNHLGATALHAVRRADLDIGESVAVFGLGLVGQLTAQFAQLAGAHVVAIGHHDNRVNVAKQSGIREAVVADEELLEQQIRELTATGVLDCGFICYDGEGTETIDTITALSRRWPDGHQGSRVVIAGHVNISFRLPTDYGNMDFRPASRVGPGYHDEAYEKGAAYPSGLVRWDTQNNLQEVIRRMASGDIQTEPLVTDRFPLSDVADAYRKLSESPNESLGVILHP